MLLVLFCTLCASQSSCEILSDNCEYCLGNGQNISCGWCRDNNVCLMGTAAGPVNRSCNSWTFKFDMKCHLESTEMMPLGARIGVTVFTCVIAVGTAVFWICIFPQCTNPKQNHDEEFHSEYHTPVIDSTTTD